MEILEGHHQQWTAQLAGLSGDFRAANTGNLGDARQQLIAPGVVTRQCHYLSVLFYPFRELTPRSTIFGRYFLQIVRKNYTNIGQ